VRRIALAALVVLIVAVAAGQDLWHDESTRPSAGDYAAETGGALLGGAIIGGGAGCALGFAGWYLGGWTSGILAGLGVIGGIAVGYPIGCGLGTALVGRATHTNGNSGGAYAGAYIGLLAAIPVVAMAGTVEAAAGGSGGVTTCVAALLPAVGAVIGYNTDVPSSYGARLAPPTLAYSTRFGPERRRYSVFDCRFVTVRF
jgi:hypothetical protein